MNKPRSKIQNNHKWVILGIFLVVAVVVALFFLLNKKPVTDSMPKTVNVSEASQRFTDGAFLLDVREPSEWNEGHVDGAVLIPLGELSNRINEVPTDQDILIICRSGNRSEQARDILQKAGLARTTSVSGGMNAWMSTGFPVITGP